MQEPTQKVFLLSQEEITELVDRCAKAGVEAYQKQQTDAQRREAKRTDKARRMKEKLACYRRVKKTLIEEQIYTREEQYEYRLKFIEDLMGSPERNDSRTEQLLLDREEKRRMDYYSIQQIDRAMELYRQECMQTGNEDIRRWTILYKYYIQDEAVTIAEIADSENVSEKTVYRDLNIACGIMYQYIIGM